MYDEPTNLLVRAEEKTLRQIEFDVAGKKILDVGCGTGRHAIRMAEAGAEVTGVDFSLKMLEVARKKAAGLGVKFMHSDLNAIPLDEPFDMVVCSLVLNHVEDLRSAMKEIARLTKVGGRVLISDMRSDHWRTKTKEIKLLENFTTFAFRHTQAHYRAAFNETGLKLNQRKKIYLEDVVAPGFKQRFLLKYFAAGYVFDLTKS